MAQYTEYEDPATGDIYRDGVRDGKFVIDDALTPLGFDLGVSINLQDNADNAFIYVYGCRGWNSSDQNFTGPGRGRMIMENCWSLGAGDTSWDLGEGIYTDNKGSGIKLWYQALSGIVEEKVNLLDKTQVIIRNCIFAYAAHSGINWTHHGAGAIEYPCIRSHIYNNFIYACVYDPGYTRSGGR